MRGEELGEAYFGFAGVYGDRLFAFTSRSKRPGHPYLTARESNQMLLYQPRFRRPEQAMRPPNLDAAEGISPGLNPAIGDPADLAIDVRTPTGRVVSVDDPELLDLLSDHDDLALVRSERALTDCRPVSLFSIQTAARIGHELSVALDKLRFRANIYLDLGAGSAFAEDELVGQRLRIGSKAVLFVLECDRRCAMVSIDPRSAKREPLVLKHLSKTRDGFAGLYAAVLVEGTVRPGDEIQVPA